MRICLRGVAGAVRRFGLSEPLQVASGNARCRTGGTVDSRRLSTSNINCRKTPSLSYYHCLDGRYPLVTLTLGQIIDDAADKFGDSPAVFDMPQNLRKNYTEYKKDVDDLAAGFLALNFQRGERIAIWSPNRYEWLVTKYAAAKAGLILVTLNAAYQPPELDYSLQKLRIRAIVMPEKFKVLDYYKFVCEVVPEIADSKPGGIKSNKHPYFDTLIVMGEKKLPGAYTFGEVQRLAGSETRKQLDALKVDLDCDQDVHIQLTSGTTGRPKAAILSHRSMINNAITLSLNINLFTEPPPVMCGIVPLFHCFGCICLGTAAVITGSSIVLPSQGFDAVATLNAIETERCSVIYAAPTMFIDILSHPKFEDTDFSSLKTGIMGASPCPADVVDKLRQKMLPSLSIGYGATETSPAISVHRYDLPDDVKRNNCGKVVRHTEVKIVDSKDNKVPFGTPGEICSRGFHIFKGYFEDEKATKEAIKDNWYHSGDLGTLSEDGIVAVIGRIKDMIIRGGENIYPTEIEDHLIAHPKIQEVQVVGLPDSRMGEEICACIKLNNGSTMDEAEVKEFCKGKLSYFKIPKYVKFLEEFPKTPTGKIQKMILRAQMEKWQKESSS